MQNDKNFKNPLTRKVMSGIITHIKGIDEHALNNEVCREPGRVRAGGGVFKSHHFRAGVPNFEGRTQALRYRRRTYRSL